MSNNWILAYAFVLFTLGSICTYTKSIKESWVFYAVMMCSAISLSYLWVVASRRLDKVADQLWYSIIWDVLMVTAYYLIPLAFYEHKMNWQSWAAIGMIVTGILWFKAQTEIIG